MCRDALPGFPLDVIRTGIGTGPNITRSRDLDDCVIASRSIQFPIVAQANVVDHQILAVLITSAPEGSRWCEIDLEPGTILLYGSGSEHLEISPAGLTYSFALIDWESLERLAEQLGLSLRIPGNGTVETLFPSPEVRSLAAILNSRSNPLLASAFGSSDGLSALHAVAAVLSEDIPNNGGTKRVTIDSGALVRVCIEYAESIHRTPSIPELSMVAHVSERRLRSAFTETVGMAPLKYFRYRLLNEARRRFIATDDGHETVSDVAIDLGFTHLGRFAGRYQQLFGELPSATLSSQE